MRASFWATDYAAASVDGSSVGAGASVVGSSMVGLVSSIVFVVERIRAEVYIRQNIPSMTHESVPRSRVSVNEILPTKSGTCDTTIIAP